jgi:hypothetical protein
VSAVYFDDRLLIAIDRHALARALGIEIAPSPHIQLSHPMRLCRTGNDIRLVIPKNQGEPEASKVDLRLIKFIARGRRWYRTLTSGQRTLTDIAKDEQVTVTYVARVIRGPLLAPDIVDEYSADFSRLR